MFGPILGRSQSMGYNMGTNDWGFHNLYFGAQGDVANQGFGPSFSLTDIKSPVLIAIDM